MSRSAGPKIDWSDRERQVLDLIADGHTNGEIAETLGISFATAKWHVSELITKLGVSSREEVAEAWRRERGLPHRIYVAFLAGVRSLPLVAGVAGVAALV